MKATVTDVKKRITIKERKTEGIISYDVDNNYPNRVRDIVSASGMGSACVKLYGKYIFGRGFQDIEFAKKKINRHGLTPDKLLRKIKDDLKDIGGFAIHINYNALYEISEMNFQPISRLRFTLPDHKEYPNMFADYPNWEDKKIHKDKIVYLDKYDPTPEIIQAQVDKAGGWDKYRGQVYYHSNVHGSYCKSIYDAELESMQTDDQSKLYKFRSVTTDFLASHFIVVDPMESGNGIEPGDREKNSLAADLEQYQGADNANKIVLIEKDSVDQKFEINKIDQQQGDRRYEWTETSTRNNIRQIFLIPPVLLMQLAGRIAGTSDEMIDATKAYNATTEDERIEIEEVFRTLFELFHDQSINLEKNFAILPKSYVEKDDATKKKNITDLVKDPGYTDEQKIDMLIKLYEVDEADARKMVAPSDKTIKTIASTLEPQELAQMMGVISNEHMTSDQKRGTLKAIFALSDDAINLIIPADVPVN